MMYTSCGIEKFGHARNVRPKLLMTPIVLIIVPSNWTIPSERGSYVKPNLSTIGFGMAELVAPESII